METKAKMILDYMRKNDGVTQMDAYKICMATRLGAIIWLLKDRGYDIETIYHPMKHGRYAEYKLTEECKKRLNEEEKEDK